MKILIIAVIFVWCAVTNIECVFGGQNAVDGQIPYHITIVGPDYEILCNGALITARFVLTTMSCTSLGDTSTLEIVAGFYDLDQYINRIKIKQIIDYPLKNTENINEGISLLFARRRISLMGTSSITAIGLPISSNLTLEGKIHGTVSGWCTTGVGISFYFSSTLKQIIHTFIII